jgi:hypothetical protein
MLGRFVQVYCDDILIFSKTREEHLVHVRMVLETLRHHKLLRGDTQTTYWQYYVVTVTVLLRDSDSFKLTRMRPSIRVIQ